MVFKEESRRIFVIVWKRIPAVLAALCAMPFIHYGSTKWTASATNAVGVADGGIDGGAGRPALPDVRRMTFQMSPWMAGGKAFRQGATSPSRRTAYAAGRDAPPYLMCGE